MVCLGGFLVCLGGFFGQGGSDNFLFVCFGAALITLPATNKVRKSQG